MNPSEKMQTEASPSNAVLLVDEDPRYLESIRNLIQRSGYSVHACNSYPEGIRQLKSGAFDIVVVGQGNQRFKGALGSLRLRPRSTGGCPSSWWRDSLRWGATSKQCNWVR